MSRFHGSWRNLPRLDGQGSRIPVRILPAPPAKPGSGPEAVGGRVSPVDRPFQTYHFAERMGKPKIVALLVK